MRYSAACQPTWWFSDQYCIGPSQPISWIQTWICILCWWFLDQYCINLTHPALASLNAAFKLFWLLVWRKDGAGTWLWKEERNVCNGSNHFIFHLLAEQWGVPVPLRGAHNFLIWSTFRFGTFSSASPYLWSSQPIVANSKSTPSPWALIFCTWTWAMSKKSKTFWGRF